MTRYVRTATLAILSVVAILGTAGAAAAQTTASQPANSWYAEFNAAATLGHRSASSVGGEGGYRLTDDIEVFLEGGHMGNVGSADLDARVQKIASAVGGLGSASYRVN